MIRYLGSRLALAILTLFVLTAVTFLATNAVPADPARTALGRYATPEQLELYRKEQGLNEPVVERYASWFEDFARGSWGTSTTSRQEVRPTVVARMVRTAIIAVIAMLIAVPLAFVIGVYTGQRSGGTVDVGTSFVTLFLNAMPEFVIGIVLLFILGVHYQVLPIESSGAAYGSGWDKISAYILPILTLVLLLTPYITRMVRVNVRDVQTRPFVQSALLRGVPARRVTWSHVAPNAALPVVNVIALTLAELVGGVVVVEVLFGFPGIGKLLVDSVLNKDIPTVQAVTLVIGVAFVVLNFTADLAVLNLNPRLRARS